MCGIAGFLSQTFDKSHLVKMTNALQHRGPDAEGYYFDGNAGVGLGHRRLSILDLSDAANQPVHSQCGRYAMVYNGEVYNYQSIKAEFSHKIWKTSSDTEVLIESFSEWGHKAVEKFNGMFAIALWDKREQTLSFFRDRIGIKPLYLYRGENEICFGSEIKSLSQVLKGKLSLDLESVYQFLNIGYITQNATIFREVKQMPAGHYVTYGGDNEEVQPYWQPEGQVEADPIRNEKTAKKKLESLLFDSVSSRMVSDVPLGTFLSGGIDSSLVTAIAQRASPKPIKSFSIGFKEQSHSESVYAEQVAKHLGTEQHTHLLTKQDALGKVDTLLSNYDQPFADSSALPTLLVSEVARKEVTVALSGDGGDEQFLGYGMYNWADRLAHPAVRTFKPGLRWILSQGNQKMKRAAYLFDYDEKQDDRKTHIFSQEQYLFSRKQLNKLLLPGRLSTPDRMTLLSTARKLSPAEEQALFDIRYYLKDDLLVKVDIASMRHSLEIRVPLLDHRIVGFSLNLHESLKRKGNITKHLLKEILYDFVPPKLFDRPKWGFSAPLAEWLKTDLKYLIDQYLSKEVILEMGLVDYQQVDLYKKAFFNGHSYHYNRLWTLILIHKWLKEEANQYSISPMMA